MRYLPIVALALGCGPYPNYPPTLFDAQATCYYDAFERDWIWDFTVGVDDPNGAYDVIDVYAEVYDVALGEVRVDAFDLFPTSLPAVWWSDWLERSTRLYCGYDFYEVDFWAVDRYGERDGVTVAPRY